MDGTSVHRELDGAYVHREEVYADYFCDFWSGNSDKSFHGIIRKEQITAREIYAGENSVRKKYICQN